VASALAAMQQKNAARIDAKLHLAQVRVVRAWACACACAWAGRASMCMGPGAGRACMCMGASGYACAYECKLHQTRRRQGTKIRPVRMWKVALHISKWHHARNEGANRAIPLQRADVGTK